MRKNPDKKITTGIAIAPGLCRSVDEYCKALGISRSVLVAIALETYLENQLAQNEEALAA